MSKWRPMRTAPKDGTVILIYEPAIRQIYGDGQEYTIPEQVSAAAWFSTWDAPNEFNWYRPDSEQDEQGGASQIEHPTLWQPMPPPPSNRKLRLIVKDYRAKPETPPQEKR